MSNRKYIAIKDFVEEGFLQEANRQFFHPLGLALSVIVDDDGTYHLGKIWDSSDDLEGFIFNDFTDKDRAKAQSVGRLRDIRAKVRLEHLGYVVQPIEVQVDHD